MITKKSTSPHSVPAKNVSPHPNLESTQAKHKLRGLPQNPCTPQVSNPRRQGKNKDLSNIEEDKGRRDNRLQHGILNWILEQKNDINGKTGET